MLYIFNMYLSKILKNQVNINRCVNWFQIDENKILIKFFVTSN
jgi:hypothetical protein